jgi:hypothetical protein
VFKFGSDPRFAVWFCLEEMGRRASGHQNSSLDTFKEVEREFRFWLKIKADGTRIAC